MAFLLKHVQNRNMCQYHRAKSNAAREGKQLRSCQSCREICCCVHTVSHAGIGSMSAFADCRKAAKYMRASNRQPAHLCKTCNVEHLILNNFASTFRADLPTIAWRASPTQQQNLLLHVLCRYQHVGVRDEMVSLLAAGCIDGCMTPSRSLGPLCLDCLFLFSHA